MKYADSYMDGRAYRHLYAFTRCALCKNTYKRRRLFIRLFLLMRLSICVYRKRRKEPRSMWYVILYRSVDWFLADGSNSVCSMNVSCRFLLYTRLASHTITTALELHQLPSLTLRMASASQSFSYTRATFVQ
jgi:hypothetical protein